MILACLRHLFRSKSKIYFFKKHNILHTCATFAEVPSFIATIGWSIIPEEQYSERLMQSSAFFRNLYFLNILFALFSGRRKSTGRVARLAELTVTNSNSWRYRSIISVIWPWIFWFHRQFASLFFSSLPCFKPWLSFRWKLKSGGTVIMTWLGSLNFIWHPWSWHMTEIWIRK